jgi:hypothetical protein
MPNCSGEGFHAAVYCYSKSIALTIRFVQRLNNGKYLVEDDVLIPYSSSITPNGNILLLFNEAHY